MTTRTKLYIVVYTASAMMLLNVFSKPLHIPEAFQWALIIGVLGTRGDFICGLIAVAVVCSIFGFRLRRL